MEATAEFDDVADAAVNVAASVREEAAACSCDRLLLSACHAPKALL